MPDASIDFDAREFDKALIEYAAASKKDWPEICNRTTRNLALRTVRNMPKAARPSFAAVEFSDWWPKYISKILRGEEWDRDDARETSKRILGRRKSSIGFMRSGFAKAGQKLGASKVRVKKNLTYSDARVMRATASKAVTEMIVSYKTKKGTKDAQRKQRMAEQALNAAIMFVTEDMRRYTERKMKERAKAISAR